MPLGGFAEIIEGKLVLSGFVASPDGSRMLSAQLNGDPATGKTMGIRLAKDLKAQGADEILDALK